MSRLIIILLLFHLLPITAAENPNIVMIISDDQTWRDFGFMGHPHVKTPHLDALAKNSALFENGYLPSSVCRPSLVTLLTGLYPHEHGVTYNHGPPGFREFYKMESVAEYEEQRAKAFLQESIPTLPRALQKANYRSFQTGKFWEGPYHRAGFTHGMTLYKPVPGQDFGGNGELKSGKMVPQGNGDWGLKIGREGMDPIYDFIDHSQKDDSPWMVWYAPYLPHQPHDSPERFHKPYREMKGVQENQIPYYASITHFDETVGDLVAYLKNHQLFDHTIIVFVADNGWSPSNKKMKHKNGAVDYGHNKTSKRAPFDEGVRSPIFFHWPEKIKAKRFPELISSIDIVPTLLDINELHADRLNMSGRSLWPILKGSAQPAQNRAVFGEIYPGDASVLFQPHVDIAYRWVRQGDYKLIVPHLHGNKIAWHDYIKKPVLYNVLKDPSEQHDLIHLPESQEIHQQLLNLLDTWWKPQERE